MDLMAYADRIIALSERMTAARDAEAAMAAFDEWRDFVVDDHAMLRSLAITFQLLAHEFLNQPNDHAERGSNNENNDHV